MKDKNEIMLESYLGFTEQRPPFLNERMLIERLEKKRSGRRIILLSAASSLWCLMIIYLLTHVVVLWIQQPYAILWYILAGLNLCGAIPGIALLVITLFKEQFEKSNYQIDSLT